MFAELLEKGQSDRIVTELQNCLVTLPSGISPSTNNYCSEEDELCMLAELLGDRTKSVTDLLNYLMISISWFTPTKNNTAPRFTSTWLLKLLQKKSKRHFWLIVFKDHHTTMYFLFEILLKCGYLTLSSCLGMHWKSKICQYLTGFHTSLVCVMESQLNRNTCNDQLQLHFCTLLCYQVHEQLSQINILGVIHCAWHGREILPDTTERKIFDKGIQLNGVSPKFLTQ